MKKNSNTPATGFDFFWDNATTTPPPLPPHAGNSLLRVRREAQRGGGGQCTQVPIRVFHPRNAKYVVCTIVPVPNFPDRFLRGIPKPCADDNNRFFLR